MPQCLRASIALLMLCLWGYIDAAAAGETLIITAPRADVRMGPDVKRSILVTVSQDAIFSLLETRQGWYKILLEDGREGWISQMTAQVQIGTVPDLMPSAATTGTQPRLALVIGNTSYSPAMGRLENPVNDATDMATMLGQLGFMVTLVLDADRPRMVQAVEAFGRQLRPRGVGLFYYAGHGVEGADGHNYLLPVGVHITSRVDVPFQGVAADWILARMEEAGEEGINIMILDACRNAPFRQLWSKAPSGFAPMYGAGGSLIVHSTAPGKLADDGVGQRNGTYTKHLLRHMGQPHVPIEQMLKQVRLEVEKESRLRNPKNPQIPWESSSLREEFYFHPQGGASPPLAALSVPPAAPTPELLRVAEERPTPATDEADARRPRHAPVPVEPPSVTTMVGKDGAEMVLVPAGEFVMGTTLEEIERLSQDWPKMQRELFEREYPQHRLVLEAFYIDRYEVTNARFRQFVQATGYRTPAEREGWGWVHSGRAWEKSKGAHWQAPYGPGSATADFAQHPVVQVTWADAKAYCAWAGKRLPTEAEWEKAARGTDGRSYPWGNQLVETRANFCDQRCNLAWKDETMDDGSRHTSPVGSYEAGKSPYGAYDMAGNVWEWVADWFEATYYRSGVTRNLQGPSTGHLAVIRGGSWFNNLVLVRTSHRNMENPLYRFSNTGLRCAKTP